VAALAYNIPTAREISFENSAILLVQCLDRKGLGATIAEFIYRYDGNILHFEQHQAVEHRHNLARVEWDLRDFRLDLKDFDAVVGRLRTSLA
jgi:formyltetrahydrofolate deformylase